MPLKKTVSIVKEMTAIELAEILGLSVVEVIKGLFKRNIMRTATQIVELPLARQLAKDLGYRLSDEEPPDDHTAPVPIKPSNPEGGSEI